MLDPPDFSIISIHHLPTKIWDPSKKMMIILSQDIPGISTNKTTQPLVTTQLAFHVSSKAPTLEDVEEPEGMNHVAWNYLMCVERVFFMFVLFLVDVC